MDIKTREMLHALAWYTYRENRSIGVGDGPWLPKWLHHVAGWKRLVQRNPQHSQPECPPSCQPAIEQQPF